MILFSSLALLFVVPICHLLLLSFNRPDSSSISSNDAFKYPLYGGLVLGSVAALQQNNALNNNEPSSISPLQSASNCSTSISTSTTESSIETTSSNPQHYSESTTEDNLSTSITTEMNQLSTASASTIQFNQTIVTTKEPTISHPAITSAPSFDDDKKDQNVVIVNILTTLLETLKTNSTNGSSSSISISNQTTQFSVCNDDTVLTFNSTVKPIAEYSIRPHNSTQLYIIQLFSSTMTNDSVADEDIARRYNP